MGAGSWHTDREGRQWCASYLAREILHDCNDLPK